MSGEPLEADSWSQKKLNGVTAFTGIYQIALG